MRSPLVALLALALSLPLLADWPPKGRGTATRSPVWAEHGMVASAQPLCTEAGVETLRKGGSAVDAAIATNACLGLMEPTANGLGGDLFAILCDPNDSSGNTAYVANAIGVYRTTDGGTTWTRFGNGLPMADFSDLYIPADGSFLRASSYGRGVWEIPLR